MPRKKVEAAEPAPEPRDGVILGKIVHWVGDRPHVQYLGKHLAGVIVQAGAGQRVNLQAFLPDADGTLYVGNCPYSEGKHLGTWHWPES